MERRPGCTGEKGREVGHWEAGFLPAAAVPGMRQGYTQSRSNRLGKLNYLPWTQVAGPQLYLSRYFMTIEAGEVGKGGNSCSQLESSGVVITSKQL